MIAPPTIASLAPTTRQTQERLCPVQAARATRESAQRFAAIVRRFSEEMPRNLDRFHEAMQAFHVTANHLADFPQASGADREPAPEPASGPTDIKPFTGLPQSGPARPKPASVASGPGLARAA